MTPPSPTIPAPPSGPASLADVERIVAGAEQQLLLWFKVAKDPSIE